MIVIFTRKIQGENTKIIPKITKITHGYEGYNPNPDQNTLPRFLQYPVVRTEMRFFTEGVNVICFL